MNLFKRILPDIVVIILFAVISFVYFFPAVTEGRILSQHDSVAGIGAGEEAKEYLERTGERTRWTNSIFGGMPTYQMAPSYVICISRIMCGMYLSCCWAFIYYCVHSISRSGWLHWGLCCGRFLLIFSSL